MKKLLFVITIVCCVLMLAQAVMADEGTMQLKGMKEFDLLATAVIDPIDVFAIATNYSVFTTENLQLGFTGAYLKLEGIDAIALAEVGGKYHFNMDSTGKILPYVGASVGQAWAFDDSRFAWSANAGVKFFATPTRAYFIEYNHTKIKDVDDVDMILFGIANFFK